MIFAALAILRKDFPWAAYVWDHWLMPLRTRFHRSMTLLRTRFRSWLNRVRQRES